jgi:dihydroorotase
MRVFVGEPGAEHRETFASAGQAAAAGGVTTIVTMPDTDPVIDDGALVDFIGRRARDETAIRVHPMAAITKGLAGKEITEFGLLREAGAVGFSDGRRTLTNAAVMRRALTYARDFDALLMHNPADPNLVGAGVMNEGEVATRLGLAGIPKEAEIVIVERDVRLAALTRGRCHIAQISCAESLEVVRRAKAAGIGITCGVSINHLTLNENDIGPYRTFFKLAPPLRAEADRLAMIAGIADGTIDVIVSSHDPQDVDTKRQAFAEAADGAVGLETLLPAALRLFHSGEVDPIALFRALATRPAELLGLEVGRLAPGAGRHDHRRSGCPVGAPGRRAPLALQEHPVRGCALLRPGAADAGRRQDRVRGAALAYPAATTSTSTRNSGRVKPPTIISVEAGGGFPTTRSRTAM